MGTLGFSGRGGGGFWAFCGVWGVSITCMQTNVQWPAYEAPRYPLWPSELARPSPAILLRRTRRRLAARSRRSRNLQKSIFCFCFSLSVLFLFIYLFFFFFCCLFLCVAGGGRNFIFIFFNCMYKYIYKYICRNRARKRARGKYVYLYSNIWLAHKSKIEIEFNKEPKKMANFRIGSRATKTKSNKNKIFVQQEKRSRRKKTGEN